MALAAYQNGYRSAAAHVAVSTELANFRKFANLNMRNLLCMQTELIMLEATVDELDQQDASEKASEIFLRSWEAVLRGTSERDRTRRETALTVRKKLQEYNEALVVQTQILNLEPPSKRVLGVHKDWLDSCDDLIALAGADRARDPLTSFLVNHCGGLFKVKDVESLVQQAGSSNIYYFPELNVSRLSN
ncbi:uncharacterized protein RAG0_02054 [Rhynchosporium agropyri]|uniref:DUF6594 domain-containing protein n=1 Tax=Rhynchosporium agropyri TaxID=914238 RepID=A0A1E1K086_9HELO|nr:uncharacterized protein RAG0_02054 [Rhynchosporium agropyri]